jgi:hypothetical protein
MPSFIFAKVTADSLVMDRLFSYKRNLAPSISGFTDDFYLKYSFRTVRRNPTLIFVPTMYSIARGNRNYIGENIGRISFKAIDDYRIDQKTLKSTIPHNRKAMDVMMRFIIPNLYGISLFDKYMLSPFNYNNRIFYRYRISISDEGRACVNFTPKLNNTQLVKGFAIIDRYTGKIIHTRFSGEYDMVTFEVNAYMGDDDTPYALLPTRCDSKAVFKFMGNELRVRFYANFECKVPDIDSIDDKKAESIIDSVRPDPLERIEESIYREHIQENIAKDSAQATVVKRKNKMLKKTWDIVDDYILSGQDASNDNASVTLSPLFNPLYLSYSHSHGLAYKMDIGARYIFAPDRYITFTPRLGYNFKIKKFYFNAPLRYTFDAKRNGWVELTWANGNRITNSSVLEIIQEENRDTIDFSSLNLDYFDDEMVSLSGNMQITKHLEMALGFVYHLRSAVNRHEMEQLGKPSEYRSFAPMVTLTFRPHPEGPTFTANYERGLTNILQSNIKYERWEFDASFKKVLHSLRKYNLRAGGGFYTNKSTDYFVDFANFHDNYIPGGWDDDWTGDFQLLNSQWYNASKYYFRTNVSYESPLLLVTWIPLIGKYIETERIYANFLQIEHTRPYTEIGYGLTNRYFSIGLFASFLNGSFNEFGSKFSFELFRRW